MTLTQIKPAGLSKPVDFADNERIRLGTGNDLQIWHDGTNSRLNSATNMFNIQSDDFRVTDAANSLTAFRIDPDGATDLRYNGSAKLQTTSTGVDILGSDTTGSNLNGDLVINNAAGTRYAVFDASHTKLNFSDNASITLGNSNDLQIYHSGSHSYIKDSGTGALLVLSNQFAVQNAAGTETIMNMVENGSVDLYYDDSKKVETTSNGLRLTSPRLVIDGSVSANVAQLSMTRTDRSWNINNETELRFYTQGTDTETPNTKIVQFATNGIQLPDNIKYQAGTGNDLQIYHDGSNSKIVNSTGSLVLNSRVLIKTADNSESIATFNENGSVELYYDNSKKFETTSYGCLVTGNLGFTDNDKAVFGVGSDLQIYHDGNNSWFKNSTGTLYITNGSHIDFRTTGGSEKQAIFCNIHGAVDLYHNNNKKFETHSVGAKVTGHLGVNREPSTSHPLRVQGSNQYIAGLTNTSASSSYFPWLLHKSINSLQAFGIHFNGLSGDPFHVDQNGAIYLGKQTATANALDDYEEGTYTPTDNSGAGLSLTNNTTARYTKIGRMVYVQFDITWPSTSSGSAAGFTLPMALTASYGSGTIGWTDNGSPLFIHVGGYAYVMDNNSSNNSSQHYTNSQLSGKRIIGNLWYIA